MHRPEGDLVRVLVADDSDIVAACLENLLHEDARIRVVARARNGTEALKLAEQCRLDVVLLDALMPEMTGITALRHLGTRCRVIIVSSEARDSALAREALAQGAHAFISKSELRGSEAGTKLRSLVLRAAQRSDGLEPGALVLIAGSTGAINPLVSLLRELREVRAPMLVVQHLPEGKDDALSYTLSLSGVRARAPEHGELLRPGVLLAPIGRHLEIDRAQRICLVDAPPVNGHRPAAEALFRSALPMGRRVVAVMLSGLGNDGARAMGALADEGAACLAQAPADCRAPSMPRAAIAASRQVRSVAAVDLGRAVLRALNNGR